MRFLRIAFWVLAALIAVPLVVIGVLIATFDANRLKPRIEAAALNATGRQVTIAGNLAIKPSLVPTLVAEKVAVTNIPGGSRPEMATLGRLELQVALLPLLSRHVEITRLVLVQPDILLERLADGRTNWQPPAGAAGQAASPTPPAPPIPGGTEAGTALPDFAVNAVRIEGGRLTIRDARAGTEARYDLKALDAALPAGGPTTVTAEATVNATPITLHARSGPLAALLGAAPGAAPFPVSLRLEAAGTSITAEGSIAEPLAMTGWKLALAATIPDMAALAPLAPDLPLPPLRGVTLKADAQDSGGPIPAVSMLSLTAGAADLQSLVEGLRLERLEVTAPAADQPVRVDVAAAMNGAPVALTGTIGAPAALLPDGPARPLPVDLAWKAAGASGTVRGTVTDPRAGTGVDLALVAAIPDLAALGKLAGAPLPALHNIAAQAQLAERGPAFAGGAHLRALKVTLPQGDLAGAATWSVGKRQAVQLQLASQRLDADALLAALHAAPPASAPAQAAPPPPPPLPAPAASDRLIPDTPLPFEALTLADGEAQITIAALTLMDQPWQDVRLTGALKDGKLTLAPLAFTGPGGRAEIRLAVDARPQAPPVALAARMPALALGPLLTALGQGAVVTGTAQVDLDIKGAGRTPHAIAASASGHLGFAMAGGDIDNRLVDLLAGDILRAVGASFNREGRTNIRCVALRLEATNGVAEARALLADTSLARLDGGGAFNLGQETLALRVRPTLKVGQIRIAAPVLVSGPWRQPRVGVDPAAAGQIAGQVLGGIAAGGNPLQALRGAGEATAADDCPRQLAIARGGAEGPVPPAEAPAAAAPAQQAPRPAVPANPRDLLRGLIR